MNFTVTQRTQIHKVTNIIIKWVIVYVVYIYSTVGSFAVIAYLLNKSFSHYSLGLGSGIIFFPMIFSIFSVKNTFQDYDSLWTEEAKEIVYQFYKEDFDIFEYAR